MMKMILSLDNGTYLIILSIVIRAVSKVGSNTIKIISSKNMFPLLRYL